MHDAMLLPIDAAIPRIRMPPPVCKVPLSRHERVDLLMRRHDAGFLLWNPSDRLDPHEMAEVGFAGAPREDNGTDRPPEFTTMEAMAGAIAQRNECRKGAA